MGQQDHLQPSLLDRLTDQEPGAQQEGREDRFISVRRLREAVIRDLSWLLNTCNMNGSDDHGADPLVAGSVLNFGFPPLSGRTAASIDIDAIERVLRQSILRFEPRILADSLKVSAVVAEDQMNHNALSFDIEGALWAQPAPLHLILRTDIDLENGSVKVVESGRRRTG